MLLKALSDFAHSRGILDDLAFEDKPVRWIIPLDRDGNLAGSGLIETEKMGNRWKMFSAPCTSRYKAAGGIGEFLVDGLTAVFGLDMEPDKKLNEKQRRGRDDNNAKKHGDFWRQIEVASSETQHGDLLAIHKARASIVGGCDRFLRHGRKAGSENLRERQKWWVTCADGAEKPLGPDSFTFQVDGRLPLLDETVVRPHWRKVYNEEVASTTQEASLGVCLVTGDQCVPIAKTHPKITGRPLQSVGAAIVSFDKPSFTSYGFDQSLNAPVSIGAVAAYCNALTALLNKEDHSFVIGDTALCFWAKQSDDIGSFFAQMLRKPDPLQVATFLKSPFAGIDRGTARLEQFYSVTLCGNAGRIAVRHWMQSTVEEARENFAQWFRDLELAEIPMPQVRNRSRGRRGEDTDSLVAPDSDGTPPLAIFRLACATVRKAKDLRPEVAAQLYQAALEGTAPSIMLIKPILHRLEADLQRFGMKTLFNISRFALLKLILNRNRKEGDPMIEAKVFETEDKPYNCGRLLAVLAETQAKAHDYKLEGAGVAERYFGTASVSPASVFPLLLRLNRHHLDKIRKSEKGGHARFIEESMQAILTLLKPEVPGAAPEFPRHLSLQEQGRFAIGFYQQKADNEQRKQAGRAENQGVPHDDQG